MEIWIADAEINYDIKQLKKKYSFLRDFGCIDTIAIAKNLGYETTLGLNSYANFLISEEVEGQLLIKNKSKRFYRILIIVERITEELCDSLVHLSTHNDLKYEKIYALENEEFVIKREIYK